MQDIQPAEKSGSQEVLKESSKETNADESESSRASTVEEMVEKNGKAYIEILF